MVDTTARELLIAGFEFIERKPLMMYAYMSLRGVPRGLQPVRIRF